MLGSVLGREARCTGARRATGPRIRNLKTNEEQHVQTDGIFVAIGHEPNTAVFRGQIPLDRQGYAQVVDTGGTMTAVEGVFVAGDVRDHRYRQAITAAGDGGKAAIDAERWLEERSVKGDHAFPALRTVEEQVLAG